MAKAIKDQLKDLTDRFRGINNVPQHAIDNIKKTAEAAKTAANKAKSGTA